MTLWFEDVVVGTTTTLGRTAFSVEQARHFARAHEPGMDVSASATVSGWQVALAAHRLLLANYFAEAERMRSEGLAVGEAGPAPGLEYIEFPALLAIDENVSFTLEITGKRETRSRPDWGLLFNRVEGRTDGGQCVYRTAFAGFRRRRR